MSNAPRQSLLERFGFTRQSSPNVRPKATTLKDSRREPNLGGFQLTLRQTMARRHGREAYEQALSGMRFDKKMQYDRWRMAPKKHRHGGAGYDEMLRTALARDTMERIHARVQNSKTAGDFAEIFSQDRANTDALVWHLGSELGGHPGALRDASHGTNVVKGHGGRDSARAKAVASELREATPDLARASLGELIGGAHRMAARGQVETLRTMSQPYEAFVANGRPSNTVFHARYGDLSDAGNYEKMARYAGNERERLKWDTARKLMGQGLDAHVPEVMRDFITQSNGDHTQAQSAFWQAADMGSETRVNRATQTQADPLESRETLHATQGRKRALSLPRLYRPTE